MTFEQIVRDSHRVCCERSQNCPTDAMIAEDIVDNYNDYKYIDLSDPYKYNEWIIIVRMELNRQGLCYKEDE